MIIFYLNSPLVVQTVKCLPTMWETRVQSLVEELRSCKLHDVLTLKKRTRGSVRLKWTLALEVNNRKSFI